MRETGAEPARVSPLDPKSSAYANSATLPMFSNSLRHISVAVKGRFFRCTQRARKMGAFGSVVLPDSAACKHFTEPCFDRETIAPKPPRLRAWAFRVFYNQYGAQETQNIVT